MKKIEKYMYICVIIFHVVIIMLALLLPKELASIIVFFVGIVFLVVMCKLILKNINGVKYTYDTSNLKN